MATLTAVGERRLAELRDKVISKGYTPEEKAELAELEKMASFEETPVPSEETAQVEFPVAGEEVPDADGPVNVSLGDAHPDEKLPVSTTPLDPHNENE